MNEPKSPEPLLDEHGRPYHSDMQLSWQTFLGNNGPQPPEVLKAYIAAWYAGATRNHEHQVDTTQTLVFGGNRHGRSNARGTSNSTLLEDVSALLGQLAECFGDDEQEFDDIRKMRDRIAQTLNTPITERVSEDRLRNTRAWAAQRVGVMSGAQVIVSAIDEVLQLRNWHREG